MTAPTISIHGLGKRYGKLRALHGVDCAFLPGETVMLIGPNASGKSTLIKCLLGLVRPTEGRIVIGGATISAGSRAPHPAYRAAIGYMPQIGQFPAALTVRQLLAMMADVRGAREEDLDGSLIGALDLRDHMDKRLSTLSGGTRQKVSAVLAFRSRPSILVMDEPTAGLDPVSSACVLDKAAALRDAGGTVLITSHQLEEVERLADRVAYLEDGRLKFLLPVRDILERTRAARLAHALPLMLANAPAETLPN